MKIALYHNAQNFGASLLHELHSRGHDVELYSRYRFNQDHVGFELKSFRDSKLAFAMNQVQWFFRKIQEHDLVLNYTGKDHPLEGRQIMYWQGVEVYWNKIERPGYYCTPDIAQHLPKESIMLPRAIDVDRFACRSGKKSWDGERPLRIGHFWKRDNPNWSYTMRYWKKSDLLDRAIGILHNQGIDTELLEGPVPHVRMPETLASLDVLAEEFGYLSHGATAVESLMTGTPVVGSYNSMFCESKETLDLLINVAPNPESIAKGILSALDYHIGSTRAVAEYYRPDHAADVLLDTWQKLV